MLKPRDLWIYASVFAETFLPKREELLKRRFLLAYAALGLLLIVTIRACACNGDRRPAGIRVSGVVTLDGKPLADAFVTFHPHSGRGAGFGTTDGRGRFRLMSHESGDGILPGDYRVTVTRFVDKSEPLPADARQRASRDAPPPVPKQKPKPGATRSTSSPPPSPPPPSPPPKPLNEVPERYASPETSGLEATVQRGKRAFQFDLTP